MRVVMKVSGYFVVDVDEHDPIKARTEALRHFDVADFGQLFNVGGEFLSVEDD